MGSGRNFMTKEHGAATIVLLIGTSSAGKGTIIKEMKKQDGLKPGEDQLEWQEDGLDIECSKHPSLYKLHKGIIEKDSDSQEMFDALEKDLGEMRVLETIDMGISELEKHKSTYSPEAIEKFKMLIEKHHEPFQKAREETTPISKIMENVFARAVENSKAGKPSVLDVVPLNGYDVVGEFNKYMDDHDFSCPSIIAVAHCEVPQIVKHMDKRNRVGVEVRDGFFPIGQYGQMYRAAEDGDRVVGQLTTQDVLDAANKYGANRGKVILLENDTDAQGLVKKLGISPEEHKSTDPIDITTDVPYDYLGQTDPRGVEEKAVEEKDVRQSGSAATTEIAKHLNGFATRHSVVPESAHPLADIVKSEEFKEIAGNLRKVEQKEPTEKSSWVDPNARTSKLNVSPKGSRDI